MRPGRFGNYSLYDYVLVNNDLNLAVESLKAIVQSRARAASPRRREDPADSGHVRQA